MENPLVELQRLGQSPWHDNIQRSLLSSGVLEKMISDGLITGLTSNPTIFEHAIANSNDYDDSLHRLAIRSKSTEAIFDTLSLEDIRRAADLFRPVHERTGGHDGFVSIEVSPKFAHDTEVTIREAHRLWKAVGKPNAMIKIPATRAGIPAIERCIGDGININVTLIFSLDRYDEVMEAYLKGLERRKRAKKPLGGISSVASFFVSRVDTLVDRLLVEKMKGADSRKRAALSRLRGRAAIANAKLAYSRYQEKFGSDRFARLAKHGARRQRPLWASTSTKNPAYSDIYYVEALVGPETVNTMPPATLVAYRDHGRPKIRLTRNLQDAAGVMQRLWKCGIRMKKVTAKLEADGVASFANSYNSLLRVVAARREAILANRRQTIHLSTGGEKLVGAALNWMEEAQFGSRLWHMDSTLWKPNDSNHQEEIKIRLGWLDVVELMQSKVAVMTAFTDEVRRAGYTHALLCGMGGSSLAPEVLRKTFGIAKGYLDLAILDSTDPAAVLSADSRSDPATTLYIISSKSGKTTEPNAFFRYFWKRVETVKAGRAGENFITITDPGTKMDRLARRRKFRHIFLNPPEIGGRYSALSYFGLLPAALMGIDVDRLLERARRMMAACGATVVPNQNPGLFLGAAIGALSNAGRDKMTLILPERIAALGSWIEQLIAESTGKEGLGILPVAGEPLLRAEDYGRDRLFIDYRVGKKRSQGISSHEDLQVIGLELSDMYDLGGEFFRWEIATAAAGWLLGIDPFDQPNVQESKDNTVDLLADYACKGRFSNGANTLTYDSAKFAAQISSHLRSVKRGDYVALTAYFEQTPHRQKLLQKLRGRIAAKYRVATTIGYGPRFLHSTGQLHKGGKNNGVFIQLTCDDKRDLKIPGEKYTFGTLKEAQSLGDYQSLINHGRRALRINVGSEIGKGLKAILSTLE